MMNLDRDDASTTDECFVTALHIFDYCGADSDGTLRVDALMDKFAPFVKTNKTEYGYLKSLLDPNQSNPEISVTMLARTLNQYSESQKTKMDFDESFNSKTGPMPQDSDSGISTDGFQLVEDLQCEVREKGRVVQQLRSQLEYSERQHEDALHALAAERDSLRAHLNLIRDDNTSLCNIRQDYEEACERLSSTEHALTTARQDLDTTRRRNRLLEDQVAQLECDKATLQELLSKSKEECHRINSMYASRQSALREDNETLRAEHADLSARLHDHDRYMQQLIKEKVLLEMELKEMVSRNNHSLSRLERSIEVSFTEDQMLSALDPLTQDSKFAPEQASVATQVEVPCVDCESRRAVVPQRGLRKYLWEPLKSLFQVFAIVSFICAVCILYGVSRRWHARCDREAAPVPWRWLDAQEFMDLLLRIEYVADVPM